MYIHKFNPILLHFGFFEIRWYSLAYIAGILIGWWLAKKIIKIRTKDLNSLINFDDLVSYLIIGIILGGRLGYVLFYNLNYYLNNKLEIIKIWEGGMSFHGALIGIIFTTYFFSKKKRLNTFLYLDVIACVAPVGIFFGRLANFINSELYGVPSNNALSVIFPLIDNIPRHPSQLYEAFLEGLVLFLILNVSFFMLKKPNGYYSGLFLIVYGFFRIICEQFREPDLQIGYLFELISMGTLLSTLMIFFGSIIILKLKKNEKNK